MLGHAAQGRVGKAESHLVTASILEPHNAQAWFLLGQAATALGEPARAAACLVAAAQLAQTASPLPLHTVMLTV